jgi:DNA-binding transcriptional LysR family regulator
MNTGEPAWDLYRSFLAVLEEGSLSGAARALALTQPTIARHIDALEESIGFELFTRSQRGLVATEGALALKPYAQSLAATASALRRAASGHGGAVRGTVRVSAGEIIGAEVLPPIVTALRRQYPQLEIELALSNRVENLLQRDADVAVRMVAPTQDSLLAKRIGNVQIGLYAHRNYLERRGTPKTLAGLAEHDLVGFDRETPEIRSMRARMMPDLSKMRFALRSDSDAAQLAAIRAGFGIGLFHVALARHDPNLVRVFADAFNTKLETWVVMHEDLRSTPRCRAVFDALATGLRSYVDAGQKR